MMRAETFFSAAERSRIEAAVQAAEERTSGEIVPLVVDRCDDYARAELIAGGSFAMAVALLIGWAAADSSEWAFLIAFLLLVVPSCQLLRRLPALHRYFIPKTEIDLAVDEEALAAFHRHGLYRTRDATGILILIALFEHRVVVLADRGINEQVPPRTWDEIVAIITAGMRDGTPCDALCHAIGRCGELLAERFPRRDDDRDELPNYIFENSTSSSRRMDNPEKN